MLLGNGYGLHRYSYYDRGLYVDNATADEPVATFTGDIEVIGACCLASANVTRIDHLCVFAGSSFIPCRKRRNRLYRRHP